MIIDVEKPSTYPYDLKNFIYKYIGKIKSIETDIKSVKLDNDVDVRCAVERFLAPSNAWNLYKELIELVFNTEIICYHATKVLDCNQITECGLKVNDWRNYCASLQESLISLGVSNISDIVDCVHKEYERKFRFSDSRPQVCFFSGLRLADGGDYARYDQFCQNIGGELARWALKDKFPEVYKKLKSNGTQLIVKFSLPFHDIAECDQESILYQFVSYYAAEYFWDWKYTIEFDGATNKDVNPEQILELIKYNKTVDYE